LQPPSKQLLAAALAAATIVAIGGTAAPALATDGVHVNAFKCAVAGGGSTTVPSGTPITIDGIGFAEGTHGLTKQFLIKQQTTLTIGNTVDNLSNQWSDPVDTDQGFWLTQLPDTPTGISLASGQSIVVTWDIESVHPLLVAYPPVGPSGDNGPYLITEDGPASCLITGA
jgi:hypothetical protein